MASEAFEIPWRDLEGNRKIAKIDQLSVEHLRREIGLELPLSFKDKNENHKYIRTDEDVVEAFAENVTIHVGEIDSKARGILTKLYKTTNEGWKKLTSKSENDKEAKVDENTILSKTNRKLDELAVYLGIKFIQAKELSRVYYMTELEVYKADKMKKRIDYVLQTMDQSFPFEEKRTFN